jgi:hypothetical protein
LVRDLIRGVQVTDDRAFTCKYLPYVVGEEEERERERAPVMIVTFLYFLNFPSASSLSILFFYTICPLLQSGGHT